MTLNPLKGANLNDIQEYAGKKLLRWRESLIQRVTANWRITKEKGRERLTVMLIPHSEKKIFNFQISFFSITSWVVALVLVVLVASITIINHSSTVKEVDILIGNEKDSKKLIAEFRKETKNLSHLFDSLRPEIIGLYTITSGSRKKANELFGGMGGPAEDINHESGESALIMPPEGDELPPEIYDISRIQKDLEIASSTIGDVKKFLISRKNIIVNTPSVWPVEGYISSLFGKRINPFTGMNEFNFGIDIVSMPGAEVHATAPGVIVFAGWDENLGLTVRIKHKYGYRTVYGYNQRITVKVGQRVSKNEVIGFVGRTGFATRYVCHYQIRIGTVEVDPLPYLNRIKIN